MVFLGFGIFKVPNCPGPELILSRPKYFGRQCDINDIQSKL
jgi:hypothetical protein